MDTHEPERPREGLIMCGHCRAEGAQRPQPLSAAAGGAAIPVTRSIESKVEAPVSDGGLSRLFGAPLTEFDKDKESNWIDDITDGYDHSIDSLYNAMLDDMLRG